MVDPGQKHPRREHFERAAERGSAAARAALEGPEIPDAVAYLYAWAMELHGRSGADMAGPALLSYQTVEAWARLTDRRVMPEEVTVLL